MILFVNACVRRQSRTRKLAEQLLSALKDTVREVRLEDIQFPEANEAFLQERDGLLARRELNAPLFALAREFAAADTVVIAAPFWDLSFPAMLKQYFEQITVAGITFRYGEDGVPVSLCRAGKLYYVTTAGGSIFSDAYGFGYVRALAQGLYGIPDAACIKAEGLDIDGADVDNIMKGALRRIGTV